MTTLSGQTMHSVIRSVDPGGEAPIEMLSPGDVLCFNWTFEDSSETRSRISQRLVSVTESAALVAQTSVLERSVPQGMEKLIAAIEDANRKPKQ